MNKIRAFFFNDLFYFTITFYNKICCSVCRSTLEFSVLNRDHMLFMDIVIPWAIILQYFTTTLKKAIMANNISECDIFSNSTDLPSHSKDLEDALQFNFF